MSSKALLTAVLEEDASSIMNIFDKLVLEKIGVILESRKDFVAKNLLAESDDDEENFDFDDDDALEWDKDHFDDPEDVEDCDDEDSETDESTDEDDDDTFGNNTGGE